jgi:hypothetical protein
MIIDDVHRAAFIHIPKNGGTSVSNQLAAVDSYDGIFRKKAEHPELGWIDCTHIPLRFMRDHFPHEYDKILAYQSFAVTRDPHARFASAIFQRLDQFRGVPRLEITMEIARREGREMIDWLRRRDAFCDRKYIHFSRQIDYVELDGERVVPNVFPLDKTEELASAMTAAFGVELDPEHRANTNFASSNRLLALLHVAKPIYARLTPWSFRERILLWLQRLNLQKPDRLYVELREDKEFSAFVEDYYAADFELHRETIARFADETAGP